MWVSAPAAMPSRHWPRFLSIWILNLLPKSFGLCYRLFKVYSFCKLHVPTCIQTDTATICFVIYAKEVGISIFGQIAKTANPCEFIIVLKILMLYWNTNLFVYVSGIMYSCHLRKGKRFRHNIAIILGYETSQIRDFTLCALIMVLG